LNAGRLPAAPPSFDFSLFAQPAFFPTIVGDPWPASVWRVLPESLKCRPPGKTKFIVPPPHPNPNFFWPGTSALFGRRNPKATSRSLGPNLNDVWALNSPGRLARRFGFRQKNCGEPTPKSRVRARVVSPEICQPGRGPPRQIHLFVPGRGPCASGSQHPRKIKIFPPPPIKRGGWFFTRLAFFARIPPERPGPPGRPKWTPV